MNDYYELNFESADQLIDWCKDPENAYLWVYWGWLENFKEWYTVQDLEKDIDPNWFDPAIVEETGPVTIYVKIA